MKRLLFPLLVAIFTAVQTFAYEITVLSSNLEYGFVDIQECTSCDEENTYILFAVPTDEYHYQFGGWEDGNKENPRTVTLTEDATFTAIFEERPNVRVDYVKNPLCTSATGEVSLQVTSGVEPFTFLWDDGEFENPRTGMAAGEYTLVVKDAAGYSTQPMEFSLSPDEENTPVVSITPAFPVCDLSNGQLYAEVLALGTEPFSFQWEKPGETVFLDFETNNQTLVGDYAQLQISHNYAKPNVFTDMYDLLGETQGASGSKYAAHVEISRDSIAGFQVSIPVNADNSNLAGVTFYHKGTQLQFTVTYGESGTKWTKRYVSIPYSYHWQKITIAWSSLMLTSSELQQGIRSLVFSSDNNQNDFWFDELSLLSYDDAVVLSENNKLKNIPAGMYSVTVTDANGCVRATDINLSRITYYKPDVSFTVTNPICETENGEIETTVEGMNEPFTYEWTDGSSDGNRQNLAAGRYILTVTDAAGCETTDTVQLEKNISNIPQIDLDVKNPICKTENGEITANVTLGTEPYTYMWNSANWQNLINFEDGVRTFSKAQSSWKSPDNFGVDISESGVVEGGANDTKHSLKIVANYIPMNLYGADIVTYTVPIKGGILSYYYEVWGVSFYHKGDGCSFKVDDSVYAIVPAHSEWTRVVLLWKDAMPFSSSGQKYPHNFIWNYCSHVNGNNENIEICLDNIEILTYFTNDNATATLSDLSEGMYSLIVTDNYGCKELDTITLKIDESTKPVISKTVTQAICGHEVGEINISYENGNEPVTATWDDNDEITTLERSDVQPGKYKITLTDSYGCEASDSTEIVVESFKYQPEIALVTVSQETSANLVVWQKEDTKAIDFYSIYRGTSSANVYEKIDDVPFSQTSIYLDENTDSKTKVYRYKISATDYCGQESPLSKNHKTINAMANRALQQDVVNIFWDGYEGFEFSTYSIYRITADDKKPIGPIDQVPSTDWTYADWNAPENTLAYYVAVELPKVIDVNEPFQKAESGPFVMAISNIAEVDNNLAVSDIKNTANVYSSHKTIIVENAGENPIVICNAIGQTIARANGQNEVKKSFAVESGVYIVIVGSKAVKVVVE